MSAADYLVHFVACLRLLSATPSRDILNVDDVSMLQWQSSLVTDTTQSTPSISKEIHLQYVSSGQVVSRSFGQTQREGAECERFWKAHPMSLWINYSIAAVAFLLAFWSYRQSNEDKPWMEKLSYFHAFFGVAALFGGFVHTIEEHPEAFNHFCEQFNAAVHPWIELKANELEAKTWFVSMVSVLLTEYEMGMAFFWPHVQRNPWLLYFFRGVVVFGCIWQLLFSSFEGICISHLASHVALICMGFAFHNYATIPVFAINLLASSWWVLASWCVLPIGPVHYNDWYHGYNSIMQFVLQWYIERSGVMEPLYEAEVAHGKSTSDECDK